LVSKGVAFGRLGLTGGHGFEVAPKPFRKSRPSHQQAVYEVTCKPPAMGALFAGLSLTKRPPGRVALRVVLGWRGVATKLGWVVELAAINAIDE
jgi:hypothetical protein